MKRFLTKKRDVFLLTGIILLVGICFVHPVYGAADEDGNDAFATARDMGTLQGSSVFADISQGKDDSDFVKFTLQKGSTVNLISKGNSGVKGSLRLDLYRSDNTGKVFYTSSADYSSKKSMIYKEENVYLSAGTYYIKVRQNAYNGAYGDNLKYQINLKVTSWETLAAESQTMGTAHELKFDTRYNEIFDSFTGSVSKTENDYIKVTTSKKDYYYISISNYDLDGMSLKAMTPSKGALKIFDGDDDMPKLSKGVKTTSLVLLPKGTTYFKVNAKCGGRYAVAIVKSPNAPNKVKTSLYGYDDVKLTWSKVSGATGYKVYYKKTNASKFTSLGTTKSTSLKKKNLADGTRYTFKVVPYKVVDGKSYNGASKQSNIYTLKKVKTPKVKKSKGKAKVYWSDIIGESGYEVARSSSKKSGYKVVKTTKANVKSVRLSAGSGKTYYYKVRAFRTVNGKKIYAPWSGVRSFKY